jgi:hypothetical protein
MIDLNSSIMSKNFLLCLNMFSCKQSINNFKQIISILNIICQDLIWYSINIKLNVHNIEKIHNEKSRIMYICNYWDNDLNEILFH